jgi:hypothetical protein
MVTRSVVDPSVTEKPAAQDSYAYHIIWRHIVEHKNLYLYLLLVE